MPEKTRFKNGVCNRRKGQRKRRKLTSKSVLKMLAVMDQQTAGPSTNINDAPRTPETSAQNDEFLQTGRTGRRNALPDILNQHALVVSTSDLPTKMGTLSTDDPKTEDPLKDLPHCNPGPSNS